MSNKATYKIDALDCKILNELQTNGRLTNLKLAEKINLSPAPTLKRVRKLYSKGVIDGIHAVVSRSYFGYNYRCYVIFTITKYHYTELVSELVKHPRITSIFRLKERQMESKGIRIQCLLESKNFDQFKAQYKQIAQNKDYLLNIEVINIAQTYKTNGSLMLNQQ
jgi:DNA-binding Lrp family transcriptional regulator